MDSAVGLPHDSAMLSKRVGENIRRIRDQRGLSLEKVAAKVSRPGEKPVRYSTIARLEKGDRKLTIEWLERIAEALNTEPAQLLSDGEASHRREFSLGEQVANEVARTLGEVFLDGEAPDSGTVQAAALILQELSATLSKHPQAFRDPQVARPVIDLLAQRHARASN